MTVKQIITNYLNSGFISTDPAGKDQQVIVANLFCFNAQLITLVLGVSALVRGDTIFGGILLLTCFLFLIPTRILKYGPAKTSSRYAFNLIQILLVTLMLFLIYSGGYQNTGPLWIYILPPVTFFFGGLLKGLRNLGIFVIIASLLLFYPDERLLVATYSDVFKLRMLYSFITVSTIFAFYEYGRQVTYKRLQSLMNEVEQQARQDPLSGLQNRRGMLEKISYEHERIKRNKELLTVMMCDVDNFKQINDKFGHDTGDYIIKELGREFIDLIRKTDVVGRWGGEEFLFLLPQTSEQQAFILAEKLRKNIATTTFTHQQHILQLTVSIGIYQFEQGDTIDQAISLADNYLYQAKKQGRNITIRGS
mgnify:FL=1